MKHTSGMQRETIYADMAARLQEEASERFLYKTNKEKLKVYTISENRLHQQ